MPIRILDRFKVPPHSAELKAYLDAVSLAVEAVDEVSVDNVHCVASNLCPARSQFAEDVKKLSEYLEIVEAVDPSRDGHPTPSCFVRWAEPEPELPFDLTEEDNWVDNALAQFWGEDANSRTS